MTPSNTAHPTSPALSSAALPCIPISLPLAATPTPLHHTTTTLPPPKPNLRPEPPRNTPLTFPASSSVRTSLSLLLTDATPHNHHYHRCPPPQPCGIEPPQPIHLFPPSSLLLLFEPSSIHAFLSQKTKPSFILKIRFCFLKPIIELGQNLTIWALAFSLLLLIISKIDRLLLHQLRFLQFLRLCDFPSFNSSV
ncbi:proline-rich receptor-like protein kinase PERK2 isoform X2 [Spinacia oleracea]|uniref:Proline-rich receptor-like protein kinase PERK2 isoform X2 n=1 Tax=Spinacia oleracea TaxID=3562 RepID=A0ABM3RTE0_SPIOL|nr:proline-rich receptor-like protein kinase PERK2 isoform X2 [Spinacia oleracea]